MLCFQQVGRQMQHEAMSNRQFVVFLPFCPPGHHTTDVWQKHNKFYMSCFCLLLVVSLCFRLAGQKVETMTKMTLACFRPFTFLLKKESYSILWGGWGSKKAEGRIRKRTKVNFCHVFVFSAFCTAR